MAELSEILFSGETIVGLSVRLWREDAGGSRKRGVVRQAPAVEAWRPCGGLVCGQWSDLRLYFIDMKPVIHQADVHAALSVALFHLCCLSAHWCSEDRTYNGFQCYFKGALSFTARGNPA